MTLVRNTSSLWLQALRRVSLHAWCWLWSPSSLLSLRLFCLKWYQASHPQWADLLNLGLSKWGFFTLWRTRRQGHFQFSFIFSSRQESMVVTSSLHHHLRFSCRRPSLLLISLPNLGDFSRTLWHHWRNLLGCFWRQQADWGHHYLWKILLTENIYRVDFRSHRLSFISSAHSRPTPSSFWESSQLVF